MMQQHQLVQELVENNPQIYNDHTMTYSGIIRKNDRLSNKQNLFSQCRSIFQKAHQSRTPSENQTLLRLVDKSEFLKELSQLYGMDFMKGILKNAKLQTIEEKQVIAQEDQEIKYMVVVLQGKLGVEKSIYGPIDNQNVQNQELLENMNLKTDALFEKLTILAKKEREQLRKVLKIKRKNTIPISEYQFYLPILSQHDYKIAQASLQRNILINQQWGGKQRLNGKFYKNRVVSTQKTTIFIIEMSFLFYWLEMAFKYKMIKNIQKLKTIPAFEILQNQKLAQIINAMKLLRKSKNSIIYAQGDSPDMIYLLVDGQLKISKEANLFKQNPNELYVDRRTLIHPQKNRSLSKSLKNEDDILPFANLTTLYNYRPTKKSIDMGIISSFGLFGQEEVILKINRETTVIVNSIEANYYQIEFKKILDIIGNKYVDKFKQVLQNSISKKVLYRQTEYAGQVLFQNQNNLTYFYLDQPSKQQSPKKVKLEKINQLVSPKSAEDTIDHVPAFYTTFNFNKMLQRRYTSIDKKEETRSNFKTLDDSIEHLAQGDVSYNGAQSKMMNMSHTWDQIEKKVMQEHSLSRRISPIRQQINIQQPLIDQQFLTDVAKQHRRINKQFRTIKFSLGKRHK